MVGFFNIYFELLQFIEIIYLLTPWCRVLLEQLTGLQLVKKFPAFHGTRRFITALKSVRHLSLSWASPIQSIYPHPTSWSSVLILSTHLRLIYITNKCNQYICLSFIPLVRLFMRNNQTAVCQHPLKTTLKGRRFQTIGEIEENAIRQLRAIT